jgi:hypothetical protein
LAALLVVVAVGAMAVSVPGADASTWCKRYSTGGYCSVTFTSRIGERISITLVESNRHNQVTLSPNIGHLDGTNDRRHRRWVDLHAHRKQNRHRFKYWRACAPSRSGWACTPWIGAGPGV